MASSSIFAQIKIDDPKKAEKFIDALESSEKAQNNKTSAPIIPVLKDSDKIRELMAQVIQRNE